MDAEHTHATLVICAHNPRPAYLERVLASVRDQSLPRDCWEFFLVDNRSTAPLAQNWDLSWHPHGRHVFESELGLSAARRRAIKEATSGLLIFVDDDNVLDTTYVARAIEIGHAWPQLGVWGAGAIIPEFEVQPTDYVRPLLHYLALREISTPCWTNVFPCFEATPWGAGLCVRSALAAVYEKYCEKSLIQITGRRGQNLISGEDLEINYLACRSGYGMGIFPELRLTHLIPKERLDERYLVKIVEAAELANLLLDYKLSGRIPKSPVSVRGSLPVMKSMLLNRGIERSTVMARARASIRARRIIAASM